MACDLSYYSMLCHVWLMSRTNREPCSFLRGDGGRVNLVERGGEEEAGREEEGGEIEVIR